MVSNSTIIRWGILGTGEIAQRFAEGLQFVPNAKLQAIGSRNLATAQTFANRYKVPQAFGSYQELVKSDLDVVYVATPHSRHKEDCILCLEAGKAVLCEKPFTMNAQEAREVIDLAREKHLFCMEAMWMRFIPLIQKVRNLIDSGEIGRVCMITAEFGYPTEFDPENRFFNPELGGGALLDRGVYTLSLAFHLLGKPSQIVSEVSIGKTGVDEQVSIILKYSQGQLAMLSSSLRTYTSNEVVIMGTHGKIRIHEPFICPQKISITKFSNSVTSSPSLSQPVSLKQKIISTLRKNSFLNHLYFQLINQLEPILRRAHKEILQPVYGNGYNYEAEEVMRCLQEGKLESQIMPLDETLSIMEAIDIVRYQWN